MNTLKAQEMTEEQFTNAVAELDDFETEAADDWTYDLDDNFFFTHSSADGVTQAQRKELIEGVLKFINNPAVTRDDVVKAIRSGGITTQRMLNNFSNGAFCFVVDKTITDPFYEMQLDETYYYNPTPYWKLWKL